MDYQQKIDAYGKEKDPQKKLVLVKQLFLESISKDDKLVSKWLSELVAIKPKEQSLQELAICPKCGQFMNKYKEVNLRPRAQVLYYKCKKCLISRAVAYLSPTSRNVVELETVDIIESRPSLEDEVSYILAEGRTSEAIKLLQEVLKRDEQNDATLFAAKKLSELLVENRNYDEAIPVLEKTIKLIRNKGDKAELSQMLQVHAAVLLMQEKAREALDVLSEMMKLANELADSHLRAAGNINIGVSMELLGEYEKAMDYYTSGLEIAEENNFTELFNEASDRINSLMEKMQAE